MIKQQIQRATKTVLGLSMVLGVSACTPTTQPWLGRADLQVPWLGRTHQAPAPQGYQRQVPQAQPYTRPQQQYQQQYQQPQYPQQRQRLPEAQPPQYVPLPPAVSPYGSGYRAPAPPSRPVATTRPLWEEERVRVQNLPVQRPSAPVPAPRTTPSNTPTPSAVRPSTPSSTVATDNNATTNSSSTANDAGNDQDAGNRYMDLAAVQVLTTQANSAVQAEEWGRASDALERALRIQPDNPRLWLRLGEVYKEQGNKQQAAEMARKAKQIAPGDAYIERRAGLLLK